MSSNGSAVNGRPADREGEREGAPRTAASGCAPVPLRLADRYFLTAHTGEERLSARIDPALVALGCAGGLLVELLLEEEIGAAPAVRPIGKGMPPDFLSWLLLREIRAEPEHDARTWVRYLAQTATEKVRARLTITEVLREVPVPSGRWRVSTATAWRADLPDRRAPADEIRDMVTHAESVTTRSGMITVPSAQSEVALALLAVDTGVVSRLGLSRHVLRQAEARAESWRSRLPGGLREVVTEVAAAREQWVMTPRR